MATYGNWDNNFNTTIKSYKDEFKMSEGHIQLYKDINEIQRPSRGQGQVTLINEIITWVSEAYGDDVKIDYDEVNTNLYLTKGKSDKGYPCMVGHLDTVHKEVPNLEVIVKGDRFFAISDEGQCGGCGDDGNAIWASLRMLEEIDVLKVAFFSDEEIGCVGSGNAKMIFFEDVNFCIQLDRRGNTDIINDAAGTKITTPEFEEKLKELINSKPSYDFKFANGSITDVKKLRNNGMEVASINLCAGYYNAHQNTEYTCISDLERSYQFAKDFISLNKETRFEFAKLKTDPNEFKPKSKKLLLDEDVIEYMFIGGEGDGLDQITTPFSDDTVDFLERMGIVAAP